MRQRAEGEFFGVGVYTTREHAYQAPEQVLEFEARHIDTTPQGDPIAWGFANWENESPVPTGFGIKEWQGYTWYLVKNSDNEGDKTA